MKKLISIILSLSFIVSTASCNSGSDSSSGSSSSAVTEKQSSKTKFTNHMTEKERNRVSVGELTVFDHEQIKAEDIIPSEGVAIELNSYEDFENGMKKYYEEHPEELYDKDIDQVIEGNKVYFEEVKGIFVDGQYLYSIDILPVIGYSGGELTVDEPFPYGDTIDDNGNFYYLDENKNRMSDEEAAEKIIAFYKERSTLSFADFEEFKPYLRDRIDTITRMNGVDDEYANELYEQCVTAWEAVINNNYTTLPAGTTDKWMEHQDTSIPVWEIDHDRIKAIAPYVKEYSIYDEQLDTNFIVHVTLPPDFDPEKTYPSYVLTDGVWRFNNCADLRAAMEEGKSSDVILVSIGYDYSISGMDDNNRVKYFCERCEDLLSFITDDLMPYLGEEYNIDYSDSTLYGHSLGGTFAHYAAFNSDRFENQPFGNYVIGSPAFWSPGFLPYVDGDEYKHEYGYFDRNKEFNKNLFICGGANEDPVYEEYYGKNDSTLEGIQHLMDRLEGYGVTTAESKIYPDSEHYQFIPEMLVEVLEKYYPSQ